MATRTLNVAVTGDARSLNRVLDQTESRTKRWGGHMAKGFAVVGAAAAGGLAVGLKKSADAAIEAEKSQAKMVTQLRAAGVSYKAHAKQIDEVIQKHSQLSGLDDEDLQDAFTNIVRVTGDVSKSLKLTGLAADFARAKHIDVAKAGELVGKVAGGNTGILSRYGITLDKGATSAEALATLQAKFAGQAEAYGKTTAGSLDRAGVASENLGEVVGAKLTPLLAKGATALVNLVDKTGQLAGPIRTVTGTLKDRWEDAVGAVRRFIARNRSDIDSVIGAMRNVAKVVRFVFEEVVVPVTRVAMRAVGRVLENAVQVIRGVIRVISGVLTGNWRKAWDGVKDITSGSLKAVVNILRGSVEILFEVAKRLGGTIVKGIIRGLGNLGHAILAKVEDAVNWVVGKVTGLGAKIGKGISKGVGSALDFINPLGDGIGKMSGGGTGLMGADFDLGPFARIGAGYGLHVSSGLRSGATTLSGNVSYHSSGDAIDMSGPSGGMMRFFKTMKDMFGSRLRELIYTPGGVGIKDGRPYRYSGQVAADHYDHVHVAYTGPFGDGLGDMRNLWTRAGGRGSAANMAAAIAMAESGGRRHPPDNINSDGSVDRGPWQINSVHGALSTHDPLGNARAAVSISSNGRNWNPWVTFKTGAYRTFLQTGGGGSGGGGGGGSNGGSAAQRFRASQRRASTQSAAARARARSRASNRVGHGLVGPPNSFGFGGGGNFPTPEPVPWWEREVDSSGQALTDALAANTAAHDAHTAALTGVQGELKRQTDLAVQWASTSDFQKTKFIADLVSGSIGRGVIGRARTPGVGVEVAY